MRYCAITPSAREGLVIAVAGFLLLIVALPSYFLYQHQYDYAKARLDNPNDNHLYDCDSGYTHFRCKVELPELSLLTILQIGFGVPLMVIGAAISVTSYARYEPKPKPNIIPESLAKERTARRTKVGNRKGGQIHSIRSVFGGSPTIFGNKFGEKRQNHEYALSLRRGWTHHPFALVPSFELGLNLPRVHHLHHRTPGLAFRHPLVHK